MPLFPSKLTQALRAAPPNVRLVPGHLFFTCRLELPAGVGADEVAGFAELNLEEISPFPLEQLFYGFVVSSNRSHVLVYAAYRRRFAAADVDAWNASAYVVPDFLPALRHARPEAHIVFVRGQESLTALRYGADEDLPAEQASRPLPESAGEAEAAEQEARLLARLDPAGALPVFRLAGPVDIAEETRGFSFAFALVPADVDWPRKVELRTDELWKMDVRDPSFLTTRRKEVKTDLVLWRALQICAVFLLLLVVGEIFLGIGRGYLFWLDKHTHARVPAIAEIENRNKIVSEFEKFGNGSLSPFAMLGALNPYKPESVYYTRASTDGTTGLTIEAATKNAADANQFEAALKRSEQVQHVEVRNLKSRADSTTFTLVVNFKPGAFNTPPKKDTAPPAAASNRNPAPAGKQTESKS